ncbi:beta-lactamase family protein [Flavobacteriaceae bacterium]|nr:beta-lactamase family protein [Flavobacteriaceae bacterium]
MRILYLFLVLSLQTVVAQDHFDLDKLAAFEEFLKNEITDGQIAGAEVLVYHQDKIAWRTNLGYSDVDTQALLSEKSVYFLQSMTKPIMSVAIMQLVEQGRIRLDEDAATYLPELNQLEVINDLSTGVNGATSKRKSNISIQQLLTHTAGLSHGLGENLFDKELFKLMYNDLFDPAVYEKLEDRLAVLLQVPLIGQPGEQWYYSGATDVLALIVQKVSGQPINTYLREHIFTPLGMNETGYNLTAESAKRVMKVHLKNEEGKLITSPVQVPTQANTVYGGTYGLFSSMNDYLQFCKMILNQGSLNGKQVLEAETVALMQENHVGTLLGPSRGFGLGFGVLVDTEKDPSPGSNGQIYWGGFFKTHFFIDPTEDLIAIFMTQKLPNTNEYVIALNRHVYGALKK